MRLAVLLPFALICACQPVGETPTPAESETAAPDARSVPEAPDETATPSLNTGEPAADACGADRLGRWLNVLPTEPVKAEVRNAVGHDRIRYIEPGDVVTMDLRPDRLNVETGTDGRIKLFRCG